MNLENQVCSLELSKRLKELGVKQESLFYRFQGDGHQYIFCKYYEQYSPHVNLKIEDGYSSFTVAELGQMLPYFIEVERDCYYSDDEKYLWRIQSCDHEIFDENEANARAKMLICLLENKLMELSK